MAPLSMMAWQIQNVMMQRAAGPFASLTIRTQCTFLGSVQPLLGPKATKGAGARPPMPALKIMGVPFLEMCTVLVRDCAEYYRVNGKST